jgi:uncharacterized tellurite resistance protein B-like protein
MLKTLSRFFQQFDSTPHSRAEVDELHSSIACLVHEARRVDLEHDAREHPAAIDALERMFALERGEAERLLERVREKTHHLTSYYPLVSVIKRDLSLEERILLIEVLWRVAYADGVLHGHEDHFVRKIAHLLYVPNTQVMLARSRAREGERMGEHQGGAGAGPRHRPSTNTPS